MQYLLTMIHFGKRYVGTKNFSLHQYPNALKQLCMCDQSVEKIEKFTYVAV